MEVCEPDGLAEVGALAGHLVVEPLVLEVVEEGEGAVREGVGGVVGGDEVLDYGAGFPDGEGGVGVGEDGGAAVGVEGGEGGLKMGGGLVRRGAGSDGNIDGAGLELEWISMEEWKGRLRRKYLDDAVSVPV